MSRALIYHCMLSCHSCLLTIGLPCCCLVSRPVNHGHESHQCTRHCWISSQRQVFTILCWFVVVYYCCLVCRLLLGTALLVWKWPWKLAKRQVWLNKPSYASDGIRPVPWFTLVCVLPVVRWLLGSFTVTWCPGSWSGPFGKEMLWKLSKCQTWLNKQSEAGNRAWIRALIHYGMLTYCC